ncbi:hypothetical protein PTSG_00322 [Salpingoeca rosetta]|uniref:Uncharacterized protein n=1 Tax=Salpingoeca rosetta (strain ATCC 50818 / BSB-021) TaxID=946362 RepID=F2TW57_SALR5|nr:uncharacterized protein PTSG_00322 [Salpingoeca rosetta]EGD72303.1 hypothetical protein PTSG_00322 [Salpingoeca rosetta]|eukprot:XP_004998873.1 hypothetical protein PTSG_00322 [Salpingoeca rosetta]
MAFLQHDMTPVEPNVAYQPSQGQPIRDHKLKAHTVLDANGGCMMLDSPTKLATKSEAPPPQPRRKKVASPDPGYANVGSHEFYTGKHSSKYSREPTGGIKAMFDNPNRMQEQARRQREFERQYTKANAQAIKQRRQKMEEEKKYELSRSTSHLTTDPWERDRPRVQPNARIPRRNPVTKGEVHNRSSDDSYAARVFGKVGAGAPRRDANGNLITKRSNTVATYRDFNRGDTDSYLGKSFGKREATNPRLKASVSGMSMHNEAKSETYNDKVFGKVGVAGRPRQTNSGNIVARHKRMLETERHHLDVPGDAYNDKVFKQKPDVKVVNGEVKASRHTIQNQLAKSNTAGRIELFDHVEQTKQKAKLNKPPKMSRDEEFKGRMLQHAPLSTSIHK